MFDTFGKNERPRHGEGECGKVLFVYVEGGMLSLFTDWVATRTKLGTHGQWKGIVILIQPIYIIEPQKYMVNSWQLWQIKKKITLNYNKNLQK